MILEALKKIDDELENFQGNQIERAISTHVANALKDFCKQETEFAQAIIQSDKTISDCCKLILHGVGKSISDLEVYQKAVQFYFSTATISFTMTIDLCGDNGADKTDTGSKDALKISLDELLNF